MEGLQNIDVNGFKEGQFFIWHTFVRWKLCSLLQMGGDQQRELIAVSEIEEGEQKHYLHHIQRLIIRNSMLSSPIKAAIPPTIIRNLIPILPKTTSPCHDDLFLFLPIIFTWALLVLLGMANAGYLDGFLQELLTAKKSHYSEDSITFYLQEDTFIIQDLPRLHNARQERLKCSLIRHRGSVQSEGTRCVIYLHGMGSTRLEALSVAQRLPREDWLCMFDLSGSGKSQGDLTTYGIKESQDIQPVIAHLQSKFGLRQFVLWGRSMGAVAALLHVLNSRPKPHRNEYLRENGNVFSREGRQELVKAIVLDSPFHNFRDVVKEMATNSFSLPSFLADTAADYIESSFTRILAGKIGEQYNPFLINFTQEISLPMPIIMVYSEKDEVVPAFHSERLIRNIRSKFEKILINDCNHNEARPPSIITSIFEKIDKYSRTQNYESRRFSTDKSAISYSSDKKRGIFVFTPSKEKEIKTSTQFLLSERKFIPPHASNPPSNYPYNYPFNHPFNHPSSIQYAPFGKQSPKSTMMTPRKTKLSLQSSHMFTRPAKEEQRQSQIVTIDTQTNSLISKKLVGVPEIEGKAKNGRSMRFNMERRREMKVGRQRYQ